MIADGHEVGVAVLDWPAFYFEHERLPHVWLEQTERLLIEKLSIHRRRHAVGDLKSLALFDVGIRSSGLERHKEGLALEFVDSSLVGSPAQPLQDDPELHLEKVPGVTALWLDQLLDDLGHG